MARPFYYGGQAVIEGVMMRGQHYTAMAVRRPNGDVSVNVKPLAAMYQGRLRRIPVIRGVIALLESLVMGTQVLFESAQEALAEEEEKPSRGYMWGAVTAGMVLAVGIFFVVPRLLTGYLINPYIGESNILSNVLEGLVRVLLFVGYLAAIARMKDVRRVFAYHGAEHKTINAYEAGVPLEVNAIRAYSTAHTRCGTSFILTILVLAIIVFTLVGQPAIWLSILYRIILIPLIAALGYEITRLSARYSHNRAVRTVLYPGLLLQSLTTREPDDGQMEMAITALTRVIEADRTGTAMPLPLPSTPPLGPEQPAQTPPA